MSNMAYNRLQYRIGNQDLDWKAGGVTIKCLLLRDTGAYTPDPDHDVIDDIISGGGGIEISVTSYARVALTNKSTTLDDVNDLTKFDADNLAFGDLEPGQTVIAAVFYEEVTDDTDSIPLLYLDGKVDVTAAAPAVVPTTGSITNVTQANPGVVTSTAHGLSAGQKVSIAGVGGMTELNGNVYTVANPTANTFELSGTDTSSFGAYTSGGTWTEVKTVYVLPLRSAIKDGAAVDFGGGATGTVNGITAKDSQSIEVINLGAAVDLGDVSSDVQTTLNLPAALGGGAFNINLDVNGLFRIKKAA